MDLIYVQSESTVRPQEIETGVTTVYLRRNIVEMQRPDPMGEGGAPMTMFTYEEAQITKDEALRLLTEQYGANARTAANLDYLSMMAGIDLPDGEEGTGDG